MGVGSWGDDPHSAARLAMLRLVGSLLSRAAPASRRATPDSDLPSSNPRLLLIRPDHVGDALLAAPTGVALRVALPTARIDWLVGPWAAEVIRRAPHADAILTCEFPGFTRRPKRSAREPYVELARQARLLRARRFDLALVLRPDHWWGALLAAAADIPHRLGYSVPECRPFLTRALPDRPAHSVERGLDLARLAAGLVGSSAEVPSVEPTFAIEPAEREWVAARLREADVGDGSPLVALHPGSGADVKNWLPERWRAVAASIHWGAGAQLVLTGGEPEAPLLDAIAAGLEPPPKLVLAGRTGLGQLAALFERCALVLGGDSGPLHLAAAVGTPTVRLYGPTEVVRFGPRGKPTLHRVIQAALPCQPCGNIVAPPCGALSTPACLRVVPAERVASEALEVLARIPSRSRLR